MTDGFNVEVGLDQGLVLSPFLFAVGMDRLTHEVKQESPRIIVRTESRWKKNLERWRCALEKRIESQS